MIGSLLAALAISGCKDSISPPPAVTAAQPVAGGQFHTCALTSTGAAYCWGYNASGQLGDGSTTSSAALVAVSGDLTFATLTTGSLYTCGLTSSGVAYCWGENESGQLGDGSTTDRSVPVMVSGALTFSGLVAGGSHTCGFTKAGTAYCWGLNNMGQLGIGSRTNSSTPLAVSGGLSFNSLTAGVVHTCGLTSSGAAYCWGNNWFGQLGLGTTTGGPENCRNLLPRGGDSCSTVPVPTSTAIRWASIAAGGKHTCGITHAGAAYCWGDNFFGQLGDGSTTDRFVPVSVSGGVNFSAFVTGAAVEGYHTCALTSSGVAYCWGYNHSGQLGDGSTTDSSVPVAVSGGLTFSILARGGDHTCGFRSDGGALYCWGYQYSSTPLAVFGWPPL